MKRRIRSVVKRIPVISDVARFIYRRLWSDTLSFQTSAEYWEERYTRNGDSGDGSYGRLARFKAEVINDFVSRNHVKRVVEFGCGDGAQLQLMRYPEYVGIDVSKKIIDRCRETFILDTTKHFYHVTDNAVNQVKGDLSLSLDVIYHLVEDDVYETYMRQLFFASKSWVIIYSSDFDKAADLAHVRHRKFTAWVENQQPNWRLERKIEQRYPYERNREEDTSFADFYIYKKISD